MKNTVLVVEDNEMNRMMLVSFLEDTYQVLEAENGREALEILQNSRNKISAVIVDLIMPYILLRRNFSMCRLSYLPARKARMLR